MPATAFKIIIPKPCHSDWQQMTPTGRGRHCADCNKTVIDFTLLSDAAIADYFIQHMNQPVCGRFYKKQLNRITVTIPGYILQKRLPIWKYFLVVLLICFGSSILPVEVKAGSRYHAYTHTTDKKIKPHKKKRHRRHKEFIYEIDWSHEMISGFTQTITKLPEIDVTAIPKPAGFTLSLSSYTNVIATKNKPSPFKKPVLPIEATLPAGLVVAGNSRRKRRKL